MRQGCCAASVSLISLLLLTTPGLGRDDGRYANSPLKSWFESLSAGESNLR